MELRNISPAPGPRVGGEKKRCNGPEGCVAEARMVFLAGKPPGYTLLIAGQMSDGFPWGAEMMALTSHFLLACLIA